MFVAIQLIISELAHVISSMNSLFYAAKLRLLHFTRFCSDSLKRGWQTYNYLRQVYS